MTNEELISKIRKEVERLIEESDFDESANLYSLLSFLSTFEKESEVEKKVPTRIYLGSKYEFIRRDIILKEIEGLKKNNEVSDNKEYAPYELDVACGYDMACDDILSFLSTLEEKLNSHDDN